MNPFGTQKRRNKISFLAKTEIRLSIHLIMEVWKHFCLLSSYLFDSISFEFPGKYKILFPDVFVYKQWIPIILHAKELKVNSGKILEEIFCTRAYLYIDVFFSLSVFFKLNKFWTLNPHHIFMQILLLLPIYWKRLSISLAVLIATYIFSANNISTPTSSSEGAPAGYQKENETLLKKKMNQHHHSTLIISLVVTSSSYKQSREKHLLLARRFKLLLSLSVYICLFVSLIS